MLTRLRQAISPAVNSLGKGLARIAPYPNLWTALGLVFSFAAALLFSLDLLGWGGVLVLLSGLMDVADGAVARVTGKVSARGGFLDSNMDRVGESAIYLGLMFVPGIGGFVAGVALASSLLVSYSRARAESAGLKAEGVGLGERAERLVILAVGGLVGLAFYAVVLVAVLSLITFLQRVYVYGSRLQ